MDAAHRERLKRARLKNLEYMRKLDEQTAKADADAFLASVAREFGNEFATGEKTYEDIQQARYVGGGSSSSKKKAVSAQLKNTSVYVTGLATYIACRQLEGMCAKIGKVRRIKFYKDERGGLKLNHFEIKPGVFITAVAAQFDIKPAAGAEAHDKPIGGRNEEPPLSSQPEPERLFIPAGAQGNDSVVSAKSISSLLAESVTSNAESEDQEDSVTRLDLPSKSIILKHVWDPLEPQDTTAFFDELEQDMRSECSKFGPVDHVHIVANGSVLVRFHALESAVKCLQIMHGRWFDGRKIDARFDQSTPEEPEDTDTKVEAFLASIG